MKPETVALVIGALVIVAAVAIFWQQQQAAQAREARLADPGQQLARGIGDLAGGIVGLATGGGGGRS